MTKPDLPMAGRIARAVHVGEDEMVAQVQGQHRYLVDGAVLERLLEPHERFAPQLADLYVRDALRRGA